MNKWMWGVIAGLLLSGLCIAQSKASPVPNQGQEQNSPSEPATAQSGALRIAPGSVIPVQLTKTIDAKKVKPGDEVVTKVTQDLRTQNGSVVIPKDTEIVGHVTEAQTRTKEQKESQLGLSFDRAVMKSGGEMNLPMSIQAVIGQRNTAENNNSGVAPSPEAPAPAPSAGNSQSPNGRNMGGGIPPGPANEPPGGGEQGNTQGSSQRPPITSSTQGIVGLAHMQLSSSSGAPTGSVLTSDKNNVKLESGTMMLLRVSQ
jgi:hypothetical protein